MNYHSQGSFDFDTSTPNNASKAANATTISTKARSSFALGLFPTSSSGSVSNSFMETL